MTDGAMSNKQKRAKLNAKRTKTPANKGHSSEVKVEIRTRLVPHARVPKGAIAADLTKQAPHGSYSPPLFYADQHFTCVDCGSEEVCTAK